MKREEVGKALCSNLGVFQGCKKTFWSSQWSACLSFAKIIDNIKVHL